MTKEKTELKENQTNADEVTNIDPWSVRKTIFIPKIPNSREQPDVVASVNLRHYSIQRGKPVEVPLPIYEVVKRMLDAEEEAEDFYYEQSKVKAY